MSQVPPGGQHDRVVRPPKGSVPDQFVALDPVADRIGIRLRDPEPGRLPSQNRGKLNHHYFRFRQDRLADIEPGTRDGPTLERFRFEARAGVENQRRRVGDPAPGSDNVEILVHPSAGLGVVVVQVERMGLGLLEEIPDLPSLSGPLGESFGQGGTTPRAHRLGGQGAESSQRQEHERSDHRDNLRPFTTNDAGSGPAFMKLISVRPSASVSTCDGTLSPTNS